METSTNQDNLGYEQIQMNINCGPFGKQLVALS